MNSFNSHSYSYFYKDDSTKTSDANFRIVLEVCIKEKERIYSAEEAEENVYPFN